MYLIGGTGTGAWTGHDNQLAQYVNGAWEFDTPKEGFEIEVEDEDLSYVLRGGTWVSQAGVSELDDLTDVNAAAPANGQVLTWDSTPGEWIAQDLPAAGAFVLDDATDVNAPAPNDGDVLTWDSTPGEWVAAVPSSSGSTAWALAGAGQTATGVYDFAVDGAKANIDFTGLGSFNEVLVIARGLTNGTSGNRVLRVSVDNGSTFYATSGDYVAIDNVGVESNQTVIASHGTASTGARTLIAHIKNMKGAAKLCQNHNSGDIFRLFVASASDINAIRVLNSTGGNMTAGTVRVYAR